MYNIDSWKNSKNPSSMASLVARETAVIHEFMHVNVIGFKKLCKLSLLKPCDLINRSQLLAKDTGSANIADMEGESPIFPDKAVSFRCNINSVTANHDTTYSECIRRFPSARLGLETH